MRTFHAFAIVKQLGGYSPTAQFTLNRLSGLTVDQSDNIAKFIDSQAGAEGGSGNWEKFKVFFFFGALGASNAPIGWLLKTGSNNGATYTNDGYSFSGGPDEYFDTMYNPTSDPGLYTVNDCLLMCYVKTNDNTLTNKTIVGAANGFSYLRQTGTVIQYPTNTSNQPNNNDEGAFAADSLYTTTRDGTTVRLFKNTTEALPTGTDVGGQLTSNNFAVGARRSGADTIVDEYEGTITMVAFGSQAGFNLSNFKSNFDTLLTDLGIT